MPEFNNLISPYAEESRVDESELGKLELDKLVLDRLVVGSDLAFSAAIFVSEEEVIELDDSRRWAEVFQSDLTESMLNHDSSIISSSSKIDSLLDEFAGELTLLKSILLGIDKTDCYPKDDIRLIERLLYDISSPRPPKEFVSKNSDADIESFSLSLIPDEDSDSRMK
nr:hypothetical protein [Tanacetum cinerariifolium]